jgi:hypothetical protein
LATELAVCKCSRFCKLEKPIDHTQGRGPTIPAVRVHPGQGPPPTPGAVSAWGCCKRWPRLCPQANAGPECPPTRPAPDAAPCRPGNSDRPHLLRSKFVFSSLLPARPSRQTICCHFSKLFFRQETLFPPTEPCCVDRSRGQDLQRLGSFPPSFALQPPTFSYSLRPAPRKLTRSSTTDSPRRQPRSCAATRTQLGCYMSRPSTLPFSASRSLLQRLLLSKDGPKD